MHSHKDRECDGLVCTSSRYAAPCVWEGPRVLCIWRAMPVCLVCEESKNKLPILPMSRANHGARSVSRLSAHYGSRLLNRLYRRAGM